MTFARRLVTSVTVLALSATPVLLAPSSATTVVADPGAAGVAQTPTTVVLDAPPSRMAGARVSLAVQLSTPTRPRAGAVRVERRVGGTWTRHSVVHTNSQGRAAATATIARRPADNVFRAIHPGDLTHARSVSPVVRVNLAPRASTLAISGKHRVVDGRRVRIRVHWKTGDGRPVAGKVRLLRRVRGHWRLQRRLRTAARGVAGLRVRPRTDSVWKAVGVRQAWVRGDTSRRHRIDNLPPGAPVRVHRSAPMPRVKVPPQARATRPGPAASVSRIPDRVWRSMVGRSWHSGCPVGRSGLRLVRINYWDYTGYRRRGELVVNARAANNAVGALAEMYRKRYPIRSMYRVDRFGWSSRLGGADDYRSMAAGNTSAFNCRNVVNRPGVRSPHSYGGSVDVNPWENPYRSATGLVPNSWWHFRSHPRVAWRSSAHPVVRIMRRHGMRWTYGTGDSHHFDASVHGRLVSPRCVGVCH